MDLALSIDLRRRTKRALVMGLFVTLIPGVFFLGLFALKSNSNLQKFISPVATAQPKRTEVFGFAPYWTLSKMGNIDWNALTTFAYFSLPVGVDGSINRSSYEWKMFEGKQLAGLFDRAKQNHVKRVITLTQMNKGTIEEFLSDEPAWDNIASQTVDILKSKGLDGVNIDFEYVPKNGELRDKFSKFVERYSGVLRANLKNPYITVSVLASSERFNRIYDIGRLSRAVDGVFMMAYDFYYRGSDTVGPTSPLYGFDNGHGPFWYDVSTAVSDFLKVADSSKIILGVPYYGWNYSTIDPKPNSGSWGRASATTNEKMANNKLLLTTPFGGWDNQAQVAWRGYWDESGWHVVYMEDEKSLAAKFDFAKEKNLGGVGIWALGFDAESDSFWKLIADKFKGNNLAAAWNF